MFLHFLEIKKEIYALNVPPFVIEKVSDHFQNVIHKRRAEQGQKMYHLYMKEAIELYLEVDENEITVHDGEVAIVEV